MFLIFLIKNICFMAFYFAYATLVFVQKNNSSMVLVYFICLICLSASYYLNNIRKVDRLKYIPMLGFIAAIIYLGTLTGAAMILFPAVYTFFIIKESKYDAGYDEFKELFLKLVIAAVLLLIIVFIVSWVDKFKRFSIPYIAVFFMSGIYLMRTIRHGKDMIKNKTIGIINISVILIVCIVCVILSSDIALNAVLNLLNFIYDKAIIPLIMGIVYAIMFVIWPFIRLLSKLIDENGNVEEIELPEEEEVEDIIRGIESNETVINILGYAVVIILGILLVRKLLSNKKKKLISNDIREYRSFLNDDNYSKKDRKALKNSFNQIRYWYRKFLILCTRKKIELNPSDSSQSIYEKSSEVFVNSKDELENMKEIYRKARYSKDSIANQDIKRIKGIYKKLENENIDDTDFK